MTLVVAVGAALAALSLWWLRRTRRPPRRDLVDRLAPFAPTPLADAAEAWLGYVGMNGPLEPDEGT